MSTFMPDRKFVKNVMKKDQDAMKLKVDISIYKHNRIDENIDESCPNLTDKVKFRGKGRLKIGSTINRLALYEDKNMYCFAHMNHVTIHQVTQSTVPRIDSSRVFSMATGIYYLLAFESPTIAKNVEDLVVETFKRNSSDFSDIELTFPIHSSSSTIFSVNSLVKLEITQTPVDIMSQFIDDDDVSKHELYAILEDKTYHNISRQISIMTALEHIFRCRMPKCCFVGDFEQNPLSQLCYIPNSLPKLTFMIGVIDEFEQETVQNYHYAQCNDEFRDIQFKDSNEPQYENKIWTYGPLYDFKTNIEKHNNTGLPSWFMRIASSLYYQGSEMEGVLRINMRGTIKESTLNKMRNLFDFSVAGIEIREKAQILKTFIRGIKGCCLSTRANKMLKALRESLYYVPHKVESTKMTKGHKKLLWDIVRAAPIINQQLLYVVLIIAEKFREHSDVTLLDVDNEATLLQNCLFDGLIYTPDISKAQKPKEPSYDTSAFHSDNFSININLNNQEYTDNTLLSDSEADKDMEETTQSKKYNRFDHICTNERRMMELSRNVTITKYLLKYSKELVPEDFKSKVLHTFDHYNNEEVLEMHNVRTMTMEEAISINETRKLTHDDKENSLCVTRRSSSTKRNVSKSMKSTDKETPVKIRKVSHDKETTLKRSQTQINMDSSNNNKVRRCNSLLDSKQQSKLTKLIIPKKIDFQEKFNVTNQPIDEMEEDQIYSSDIDGERDTQNKSIFCQFNENIDTVLLQTSRNSVKTLVQLFDKKSNS